jgi:hypothetical protein
MVLKTNSGIEGGFWTNGTTFSMGTNTNYPLNFIVASSNKGIIQTNGNWGIGTIIDAGYKLDVNGNTRLFGDASVSGSLAVNYPSLPSIYKLGVGGSAVVKGSIVIQDDSGAFVAYSTDGLTPAGGFLFNQYVGATIYSSNANPLKFSVNNAEALRVFNGGNISIGSTTNAGYKFDVQGTSRFNGNSNITGSLTLTGAISTGGQGYFAQGVWANTYRNLFGAEVYRITLTTNNLLLGTTVDSGYKLNVSGSGGFSGNLTVTGSLNVTGGITGSLLGTASYATQALSASYAPSTPTFPYTGSAIITGSLSVTGTTIAGFNPTPLTGSIRDGITSVLGDLQDWNDKYYSGEVLYSEVSGEALKFGQLCYRDRYGKWSKALANVADAPAYNMLGICLHTVGAADTATSILTRGYVETTYIASGREGDPIFIDASTGGTITNSSPAGAGNVVRIIGNVFWDSLNQTNSKFIIYFNPDNTWIEL